ncbi:response regulator transcription factor [Paenibacillus sp. HN-1]|uniref:response regulator transcription factor n=1 Tax=Paenibacillus TaxID=44249 RepID=UPI001CA8B664|nr:MULTISPECIES: response regulator transcription factor [Paenibacillus]MBY9077029.1 response regulator transcription factor [Paenibacillus sp. CGMCC 1.18879]MBY9086598.1 response regulator transcription factor [Paenibacillus sinensis]
MIKVLIVDDEPKLREGLRTLIPWEELGYTVVATAGNGAEALKKYHVFAPELIIADIRMPVMDGLRLLSELRQAGERCHVLILSGHADFEYAKQAISHRADGYLLKPVDEDELMTYLNNLREVILKESQLSQMNAAEQAASREALLYQLLHSGGEKAAAEEAAVALGLAGKATEVVLIELKRSGKNGDEREEQVKRALEHRWSEPDRGLFFSNPPYLGLLLTEPLRDEAARGELWRELDGLIAKEGLEFSAAAGGAAGEPVAVATSFSAARESLGARFFGVKDTLLSGRPEEWPLPEANSGDSQVQSAENGLLLAVETGSTESMSELVGLILAGLVSEHREERYLKDHLMRIISGVSARLETAYPEIKPFIAESAHSLSRVYTADYLSELQSRAADYLQRISDGLSAGRGDEIKRITDLIQRRYNENLKLGTLADMFNYNSAYLGKMFKNHTGEHFNTYLDKVRIEKAKQFLAQGMKVYEVAERVGYMNPDYFNAKFRKYVGVSPTAYRKER